MPAADDLESAFQGLKDAEAKKDAAQVKKLAAEVSAFVREAIAAPAPQEESEKEAWTKHIVYVKQIQEHTEYAVYSTAMHSQPAEMLDLLSALEQQNPKSKYLDEAYGPYCAALSKTGGIIQNSCHRREGAQQFSRERRPAIHSGERRRYPPAE